MAPPKFPPFGGKVLFEASAPHVRLETVQPSLGARQTPDSVLEHSGKRHHMCEQVVVATGKPRGPWAATILPRLGPEVPGVFMQVSSPRTCLCPFSPLRPIPGFLCTPCCRCRCRRCLLRQKASFFLCALCKPNVWQSHACQVAALGAFF